MFQLKPTLSSKTEQVIALKVKAPLQNPNLISTAWRSRRWQKGL